MIHCVELLKRFCALALHNQYTRQHPIHANFPVTAIMLVKLGILLESYKMPSKNIPNSILKLLRPNEDVMQLADSQPWNGLICHLAAIAYCFIPSMDNVSFENGKLTVYGTAIEMNFLP